MSARSASMGHCNLAKHQSDQGKELGLHPHSQVLLYLRPHSIQFNSIQFNSIQFNSIQFNSIQFNSIQFNSIKFNSIQFNSIQFNSIQFNSIQFKQMASPWTLNLCDLSAISAGVPPMKNFQHVQGLLQVLHLVAVPVCSTTRKRMRRSCGVTYEVAHTSQAFVQVFFGSPMHGRQAATSFPVSLVCLFVTPQRMTHQCMKANLRFFGPSSH